MGFSAHCRNPQLRAGELRASSDFFFKCVLEVVGVLLQYLAVAGGGCKCSKSADAACTGWRRLHVHASYFPLWTLRKAQKEGGRVDV